MILKNAKWTASTSLDMLESKGVNVPVIMISGHGTVETAVQALKKGAFRFYTKAIRLETEF